MLIVKHIILNQMKNIFTSINRKTSLSRYLRASNKGIQHINLDCFNIKFLQERWGERLSWYFQEFPTFELYPIIKVHWNLLSNPRRRKCDVRPSLKVIPFVPAISVKLAQHSNVEIWKNLKYNGHRHSFKRNFKYFNTLGSGYNNARKYWEF